MTNFKYIYGPVYSWRLGRSLGVDPLSMKEKVCNMDCVYCQLGRTAHLVNNRLDYVSTQEIIDEVKQIPLDSIDHITFSGRGEPTLAKNLGDMIRAVKVIRKEKIAVITNSSLMFSSQVREDLMEAHFVLAKLDASNQFSYDKIDQGVALEFNDIIQGIKDFRSTFKGKLALQIMLLDQNKDDIGQIAKLAKSLGPDEIQLNTPLRPGGAKPLGIAQLEYAKRFFSDVPVISVFDEPTQEYTPMDNASTISRHGNFHKENSHY